MLYLSQLLGKTIYFQDLPYGKIIDFAIFQNRPHPPISKIEIIRNKKKLTISPHAVQEQNGKMILTTKQIPFLPYDKNDFYLAEDLLDKQVIDVNGKRLVRVNDVALESNGELKVMGIDIGFRGILRRLGVPGIPGTLKILPWDFIEAFDYHTGNVKIKFTQTKLNHLHPSEIADILEDAGTKERLGIVAALDTKKAARAIEEANSQTQISILEELPALTFKDLLNKIHTSELADVFQYLNPLKIQEIQKALATEKAQKVRKLLTYSDDVAGGLMHPHFFAVDADKSVKEITRLITLHTDPPETIIVTNGNTRLVGIVYTKNLFSVDPLALIREIVKDKKFVYENIHFANIFKLFAEYNLRSLPVVDKDKKPIGIILIDDLLRSVEEQNERDENL